MNIATKILENERDEIQMLFERLASLNALAATLSDARLEIDEQNWFYNKLINDLTKTRKKFDIWWDRSCEKYELNLEDRHKYVVDFENKAIVIDNE
ncbi:CXXX repeat peptide modification system protein [Clostridium sporogenes]|uniref:CXXX repeat peptide modification system protein n=1 Tax=Clostridium sporogenes TaxID=1509 RepID=UPI00062BFB35|nr:CXXX repeat peptide modification system protein [Clostridium sporogenes]MDU1322192.1 CXXX repeat peptide modification system protein [Clostridium botulinum]MBY7013845.1 CXXX repeat peptide modification system protein [Clostridium sporogenes]MDS1005878.1 CXXX repeat peptide modification system protein [Clostridium sporogenes]NFR35145.1 CXXX repeat peptide modification system protein [Clostridium sporogenes]NFR55420.1 CXXX repeat peptide modification system protein [Clostridium sporogenes]